MYLILVQELVRPERNMLTVSFADIETFALICYSSFIDEHCVCCVFRFRVDGEAKYLTLVQELVRPERNTLTVSFADLETFNQQLTTTILEEYYR